MKLRIKIMLCTTMLLSLTFAVSVCALITVSFRSSLTSETDNAKSACRMVENILQQTALEKAYSWNLLSNITDTMFQIDDQANSLWSGLRLETVSGDRKVVYEAGTVPPTELSAERIDELLKDSKGVQKLCELSGRRYIIVTHPMIINGQTLSLQISRDVTQAYGVRDSQLRLYRLMLIAVLVIGAGVSYLVSLFITRPFRKLSETAKKIAAGDLTSRAAIRSGDEIELLARDFNNMADKLEDNIETISETMRRQEEFMGAFAHELKTPMTSIIGYADLLRGQSLDIEEQQEAANYIFSESKRLESLSLKLLDLLVMNRQELELKAVSPAALIGSLVKEFKPVLQKQNVVIQCKCQEGKCLLEPDLVKSLLINLMDNARKALDNGGNIYILSDMTPSGCAIRVVDNGRGMPQEALSRITEAFYRVDKSRSRAQGGVGLGLSLCRQIVELHNGTMEFESIMGKGTIVKVALNGGAA